MTPDLAWSHLHKALFQSVQQNDVEDWWQVAVLFYRGQDMNFLLRFHADATRLFRKSIRETIDTGCHASRDIVESRRMFEAGPCHIFPAYTLFDS